MRDGEAAQGRDMTDRTVCCAVVLALAGAMVAVPHAAATAQRPMRIALLVDTSAATSGILQLVRPALVSLIDAVPADAELLLVSTGRRTQVRVPPTADREKVKRSATSLLADGGATTLIDALMEVDQRFMQKASDRSPVFVILTGDGSESSGTDGTAFTAWLRGLAARHVTAHAVVVKSGNGAAEIVARAASQATGGLFETVSSGTLDLAIKAVVARIAQD